MTQLATPRKSTKTSKAAIQSLPPLPPKKDNPPPAAAPQGYPPSAPSYSIMVAVDWENLPLQLARDAYEKLSKEYERAGKILNERSTAKPDAQFHCFMAGKPGCCKLGVAHKGMPRFTDLSYKAPKGGYVDKLTGQHFPEGLSVRVDICSELCYHRYNELMIAERRERMNPAVNG